MSISVGFVSISVGFVSISVGFVSISVGFVSISVGFVSISVGFVSITVGFVSISVGFVSISVGFVSITVGFVHRHVFLSNLPKPHLGNTGLHYVPSTGERLLGDGAECLLLHYTLSAVLLLTLTHVSLGLTKHWPCL